MELTCRSLATMRAAVVRRTRRLPLSGDILVNPGDCVEPDTIVGYNSSEECLHFLRLEVDGSRLLAKLLKRIGDEVKRGEPVAYYMYFFGLGYKEYVSPVNGTIVSFDPENGLLGIREHPLPVRSGVFGRVESIIPGHSASILSRGTWIEGITGWGGQTHGELLVVASSADEALDAGRLGSHCRGKLVVAGGYADGRALINAYRHGARGLIAGGVDKVAGDEFWALCAEMTYEEYAARFYSAGQTAQPEAGGLDRVTMPVLALDGLGRVPVRAEAFELLLASEGRVAYLDGVEPGGATNGRPELLISVPWGDTAAASRPGSGESEGGKPPSQNDVQPEPDEVHPRLSEGLRVRVIGGSQHGRAGRVVTADTQEMVLQTGLRVPGAAVAFDSGEQLVVPVANLEAVRTGR